METLTHIMKEYPFVWFFFFGVIALYFRGKVKAIDSAERVVNTQNETAEPAMIAQFREETKKLNCLNEFNEELSKIGAPIFKKNVYIAFEKAKKAVGKDSIL